MTVSKCRQTVVYFYLYVMYRVWQRSIPWSCLLFSEQWLGILKQNFTHLLPVHTCINRPSSIWYSLTIAKLQNFWQDSIVILHVQKFSVVMNSVHWKQLGASSCLWHQSNVNVINKVCKVFSLNFWSYLLTISHLNWNVSLNSSRHCRWSGTTCHQVC